MSICGEAWAVWLIASGCVLRTWSLRLCPLVGRAANPAGVSPLRLVCSRPVLYNKTKDDAADALNRLVTGELETHWNRAPARFTEVEGKITVHDRAMPLRDVAPVSPATLAGDLKSVWNAQRPTRLKKRIVRTVIH